MDYTLFEFTDLNDLISLNQSYESYFDDMKGDQFYEEVMTEATIGATKGNIFQRLWNLIKRFLAWIGRAVQKIKNFITGKKNTVDVNKVLQSYQVTPSENNKKEFLKNIRTENGIAKYLVKDRNNNDVELSIPVIIEGVMCVCRDKKLMIRIDKYSVGSANPRENKNNYIKDNKDRSGERSIKMVIKCIKDGDRFNTHFVKQLKFIANAYKNNQQNVHYDIIEDYMNNMYDNINIFPGAFPNVSKAVEIEQGELDNFQKIITECSTIIENLTTSENMISRGNYDKMMITAINAAGNFLANLQMGVSAIIKDLSSSGAISAEYFNSVNDPISLSKIVDELIGRGVTGKYLESIIYTISGPSLCGDKYERNGHFIAGESRCILFPKTNKKIVYKVGYSAWGRASNKSEVLTSDIICNRVPTLKGYIAKASKVAGCDSYVITQQERIEGETCSNYEQSEKIKSMFNQELQKHNIQCKIEDIHPGNMIDKYPHPIVIDYGWGQLAV